MTEQQPRVHPAMRTLYAALDGVLDVAREEAAGQVMRGLQVEHVRWHEDHKSKPSPGCHTCILLRLAVPEQNGQDEVPAELETRPAPVKS